MNSPALLRIGTIALLCLALLVAGCTQTSPPVPVPMTPSPAAGATALTNAPWSFVVMGDSPDGMPNSTTGISPALPAIAKAVATENADLVVYTGDLISGGDLAPASPVVHDFPAQYGNWMAAVSPIHNYTTGTGIPLYVLRGNHDNTPLSNVTPILTEYRRTAAAGMPANGPPGEELLSYSFTHKGAKFIVSDQYFPHNGRMETVNQSWVDGQLGTDTRPFTFVFGHSPAYLVDIDIEDVPFSMPLHPAERDAFWQSLVQHHVSAYLCGHAHMYVRAESGGIPQVVSGNAGAPPMDFFPATADKALAIQYPLWNISAQDQRDGYLVVTVNETAGTWSGVQKMFDTENGTWITGDMFTYPARSGA
jgi:hypothetical protein